MMKTMSENAKAVLSYVRAHAGENFTANDIADATGLGVKTVNGIVTMTFQKNGLMERVPAVIQLEDNSSKPVKFIRETAEGKAFDYDSVGK